MKKILSLVFCFILIFNTQILTYSADGQYSDCVYSGERTNMFIHHHSKSDSTHSTIRYDVNLYQSDLHYDSCTSCLLFYVGGSTGYNFSGLRVWLWTDADSFNSAKKKFSTAGISSTNYGEYNGVYFAYQNKGSVQLEHNYVRESNTDYVYTSSKNSGEAAVDFAHLLIGGNPLDDPSCSDGNYINGELTKGTVNDLECPLNLQLESISKQNSKVNESVGNSMSRTLTWSQSDNFDYRDVYTEIYANYTVSFCNRYHVACTAPCTTKVTKSSGFIACDVVKSSEYAKYGYPYYLQTADLANKDLALSNKNSITPSSKGYSLYRFIINTIDEWCFDMNETGIRDHDEPDKWSQEDNSPSIMIRNTRMIDGVQHVSNWVYLTADSDGKFKVREMSPDFDITDFSDGSDRSPDGFVNPEQHNYDPDYIGDAQYGSNNFEGDVFSFLKGLVNNLRDFPSLLTHMFGFLPSFVVGFIATVILLMVALRVVGR